MVDRIQKALDKIPAKEKALIKKILLDIKNNQLTGLDIKKLKGHDAIYRVRKGKIRILYRAQDGEILVLAIEFVLLFSWLIGRPASNRLAGRKPGRHP